MIAFIDTMNVCNSMALFPLRSEAFKYFGEGDGIINVRIWEKESVHICAIQTRSEASNLQGLSLSDWTVIFV